MRSEDTAARARAIDAVRREAATATMGSPFTSANAGVAPMNLRADEETCHLIAEIFETCARQARALATRRRQARDADADRRRMMEGLESLGRQIVDEHFSTGIEIETIAGRVASETGNLFLTLLSHARVAMRDRLSHHRKERDTDVVRLAGRGWSNAAIGKHLSIHPNTVSRIVRRQLREHPPMRSTTLPALAALFLLVGCGPTISITPPAPQAAARPADTSCGPSVNPWDFAWETGRLRRGTRVSVRAEDGTCQRGWITGQRGRTDYVVSERLSGGTERTVPKATIAGYGAQRVECQDVAYRLVDLEAEMATAGAELDRARRTAADARDGRRLGDAARVGAVLVDPFTGLAAARAMPSRAEAVDRERVAADRAEDLARGFDGLRARHRALNVDLAPCPDDVTWIVGSARPRR